MTFLWFTGSSKQTFRLSPIRLECVLVFLVFTRCWIPEQFSGCSKTLWLLKAHWIPRFVHLPEMHFVFFTCHLSCLLQCYLTKSDSPRGCFLLELHVDWLRSQISLACYTSNPPYFHLMHSCLKEQSQFSCNPGGETVFRFSLNVAKWIRATGVYMEPIINTD